MTETSIAKKPDSWLKTRIELNKTARFGLQDATPGQLNIIFVLAQRWQLDPVTDLTLYQGHPWITLDGWLRLIRRHPDYHSFKRRPLSEQERLDGGWNKTDIVWQTDIETRQHGVLTDWGKVTRAEVDEALEQARKNGKRAAPVGLHPVEIAQKRSLARAARVAFGQDVPEDADIEQELVEETQRRAMLQEANGRQYADILDTEARERQVIEAATARAHGDPDAEGWEALEADRKEHERQQREEGLK